MLSRRTFLQGSALAAVASTLPAKTLGTIGVQLYTVRGVLPEKPAETLRAIDAIGYREIEGTQGLLDKIVPALEGTKLKPVSIHLDSKVVTQGTGDDLARVLETVKKAGFTFAVMPYLPPNERGGLDVIKKLAETLSRAGEKCRSAGLRLCYHNHSFEFEPMRGGTPFETLMSNTDPNLVALEMDLFWVSVAGQDVVATLAKYKGRTPLIHLKDKAKGTPDRFNESVDRAAFKEVGNGTMDWPKILKAAEAAGVEHYFVEQDQTPGDPVDSLRQSFAFVSKVNY
jgi:sugar phosphate isomerase/epimerase